MTSAGAEDKHNEPSQDVDIDRYGAAVSGHCPCNAAAQSVEDSSGVATSSSLLVPSTRLNDVGWQRPLFGSDHRVPGFPNFASNNRLEGIHEGNKAAVQ